MTTQHHSISREEMQATIDDKFGEKVALCEGDSWLQGYIYNAQGKPCYYYNPAVTKDPLTQAYEQALNPPQAELSTMYNPTNHFTMTFTGGATFDFNRGELNYVACRHHNGATTFIQSALVQFAMQNQPKSSSNEAGSKPPAIILFEHERQDSDVIDGLNAYIYENLNGEYLDNDQPHTDRDYVLEKLAKNGFEVIIMTIGPGDQNQLDEYVMGALEGYATSWDIQALFVDPGDTLLEAAYPEDSKQKRDRLEAFCKEHNTACVVTHSIYWHGDQPTMRDQWWAESLNTDPHTRNHNRILLEIENREEDNAVSKHLHYLQVDKSNIIQKEGSIAFADIGTLPAKLD